MNFTDYIFIPTFIAFISVYFCVPIKKRWIVVLVASILFFCSWGIELLPWALFAVFISWRATIKMDKAYVELDKIQSTTKQKEDLPKVKKKCKHLLWWAVALILGVLVYTKAQNIIMDIPFISGIACIISDIYRFITQIMIDIPVVSFLVKDTEVVTSMGFSFFVPLGISYYTMSLIGYMADVYWRKEKAEKNPFKLLLFALYFPKVLQGPISKHKNIAKQLYEGSEFDYKRLCFGFQRMLWGYFKKMVIADRLSLFVNPVFTEYNQYGGSIFVVAAILGAFQLYCDFSGCMDIAIGASEILGIKLEENFNHPFSSKTASEFWRRWHITLGAWFKDYIYMPLVISPNLINLSGKMRKWFGKRAGKAVVVICPLVAVWLLTGLWHGTGWNYIIWGIYWGLLIIISTVFEPEIKKFSKLLHINTDSKGFQIFCRMRTFILFVISRIVTIPSDVGVMSEVFRRILFKFSPWQLVDGTLYRVGLNRSNFTLAILALLLLWKVSRWQDKGVAIRESIAQLHIIPRWIIYLGGVLVVLIFGVYGAGYNASSFVYMKY